MPRNDHQAVAMDQRVTRYQRSVFLPWATQKQKPLMITKAEGVRLELACGTKLIDMKSQAFSANLGHGHKGMTQSISDAALKTEVFSSDAYCEERMLLAEELLAIAPQGETKLSKVFFTLGGAEANENAIKIARMYTGRHKVITRFRSYHGATLATINLSGDYRRIPFDSALSGVVRFPDPYPRGSGQTIDTVRLLEEIIEIEGPETICAVLLEGITGANGVFVPPKDYWLRIRQLCDQHGILLIADEVLSGFFRCGRWFAVDHFGITPDIITMSKGLTAGYAPLGGLLVSQKIASFFDEQVLWCGLTNYGHYLSCATARAAIRHYHDPKLQENVETRSRELHDLLEDLKQSSSLIAETRCIGLLAAIDVKRKPHDDRPLVPYRAQGKEAAAAARLGELLKEEGVHALVRFGTVLIAPPLIISKDELKEGMEGLTRAIKRLQHCPHELSTL